MNHYELGQQILPLCTHTQAAQHLCHHAAFSVQFISVIYTGARSLCDEPVRYAIFNGCVVSVSEGTKQFKQNYKKEKKKSGHQPICRMKLT